MTQKTVLTLYIALLVGLLLTACGESESAVETQPTEDIPIVVADNNEVSAESFIQPIRHVDLAFDTSGRIVEILVEEGSQVQAGDVIARLDSRDLEAAVVAEKAALKAAQAELLETKAGPTEEAKATAQAAIIQAQARLVQLLAGASPEQIALAQAKVRTRQAELNEVMADPLDSQKDAAATSVLLAQIELAEAQTVFDKGEFALDSELRAAKLGEAGATLKEAEYSYSSVNNGATQEAVAVAQARVGQELATFAKTQSSATVEAIFEAQLEVRAAEVNLANLVAGATAEKIAVSEANVKAAEVSLEKAKNALDDAVIVAPFDGTIASLDYEVGEVVVNNRPVATLADLSEWLVETDDLTEIDVVEVAEGQRVRVQVDALPDETFSGTVTRIKPQAETKAGDVTYTIEITLDGNAATDARLRWGMTVQVDIEVEVL